MGFGSCLIWAFGMVYWYGYGLLNSVLLGFVVLIKPGCWDELRGQSHDSEDDNVEVQDHVTGSSIGAELLEFKIGPKTEL